MSVMHGMAGMNAMNMNMHCMGSVNTMNRVAGSMQDMVSTMNGLDSESVLDNVLDHDREQSFSTSGSPSQCGSQSASASVSEADLDVDAEDVDEDEEDNSGDSERKSRRRRKICRNFTCQEFIELMHLSQREAAKELNVCLSTFKRQFSAIRPKLSWPTPSQRKILLHRRRFQSIIEQNQEEFFPSAYFEFGKDNNQIFEEIFPDPKVLSEECLHLRRTVELLRKENQYLREKLSQQSQTGQESRVVGNPFPQDFFPVTEDDCDSTHEAYEDSCAQPDFYSLDSTRSLFGI